MASTIQNRYKDLDISFRKNPKTSDFYELKDIEAVKRSVKLLVLTNFSERPFHPEIGSAIYSTLFDNFTQESRIRITRSIKDVINNFEPRAKLLNVTIKELPDSNSLYVNIYFNIINLPTPVSVELNLERVR